MDKFIWWLLVMWNLLVVRLYTFITYYYYHNKFTLGIILFWIFTLLSYRVFNRVRKTGKITELDKALIFSFSFIALAFFFLLVPESLERLFFPNSHLIEKLIRDFYGR